MLMSEVLLSPRSMQAVASIPTKDPFVSPHKSKAADQGWAAFEDSPQAMDVEAEKADLAYQLNLDK
jgi:hypothetical protein